MVPATDAPNVSGARALGLPVGAGLDGEADLSGLRSAVDQGRVAVLYVLDPGPDGSMGDLQWLLEARKAGRLPVLIYQGVLSTALSKVADVVLPGAAWVEKDATYTNDQGLVQAASRAINPPGDAVDDWQIITSVAASLGLPYTYTTAQQVRADVAQALQADPSYAGLADHTFNRPMAAAALAEGQQPDGAHEVERHVPGSAAREGAQRADGTVARRRR